MYVCNIEMRAIIEIPKHSNLKYEYNEETKTLHLDRVLHNTNRFPYNYGFIPGTLAPDGDPVDVILLSSHSIHPGTMVDIRILGGIETHDEKGQDDKIICVLDAHIDNEYAHIHDIAELPEYELQQINYFLTHYKDGEANKFINIKTQYDKQGAVVFIEKCSDV
jgi:inorganic pyrophosphatase